MIAAPRWIDVTIEVQSGQGPWSRSLLAKVFGPPPPGPPGVVPAYEQLTAICLYAAPTTGSDPAAPLGVEQAVLAATVRPRADTGIYPARAEPVRLHWDGIALRVIVRARAEDRLDEVVHVDLDLDGPLRDDGHATTLAFTLPLPYLAPSSGGFEYVGTLDVPGYTVRYREDGAPRPAPATLRGIFEQVYADRLTGGWPVVLDPRAANLVDSTFHRDNAIHFTRDATLPAVGTFEPTLGNRLTVHVPRMATGSRDWRTHPDKRPALWPYGLMPRGTAPTQDMSSTELAPWAVHQPPAITPAWRLDVDWSGDRPVEGPPGIWNKLVASHLLALEAVRSGSGGSMLPHFIEAATAMSQWRTSYRVRPANAPYTADHPRITVSAASKLPATFPGLRCHDSAWLPRLLELGTVEGNLEDDDAPDGDDPARHHWAFLAIDASLTAAPHPVRIGALDLAFSPAAENPVERYPAGTVMASAARLDPAGYARPIRIRVDKLHLAVGEVIPADQDPTERDAKLGRAPKVLVFSPTGGAQLAAAAPRWALRASEAVAAHHDHFLELQLEAPERPEQRHSKLIVLDEQPFLVAQIELDPSSIKGSYADDQLEGRAWLLTDHGAPARIRFPPQVIGEEMIKSYRGAPYTPDPRAPLQLKLSRTAELAIARSERDTAVEAPWNLQRLLGWPGRTPPGARLQSLVLELLYGLETRIEARDLRVLELAAAVGALRAEPLPANLSRGDPAFFAGDRDVLAQLASRIAYVYIADAHAPYPPATIEAGLRFRFRRERQVAYPLDPGTETALGGYVYRKRSDGALAGGVDWGFESRNTLKEVLESGTSSTGRVVAPALTALGGFGFQKASFASDKTRIYSDTALGRTTYYALERIGRIGVLWHRAKHVIVYERTTAASEQFPDHVDEHADPHTEAWRGRPVVRKVREYVELLEDKRSYPDGDSRPSTRGPMLSAAFLDRVIPVDSAWGRDVPGGWVVPLYRPDATSKVYFRPRVQLQLATASEPSWHAIDDPEKLVFYTSTDRALGTDTSAWPPVAAIDFPVASVPVIDRSALAPADETPRPDGPAVEPGYEKFTFRLGGNPTSINIAAERGAAAIETTLRNLTLARRSLVQKATGLAFGAWDDLRSAIGNFEQQVAAASRTLGADIATWQAFATKLPELRVQAQHDLAAAVRQLVGDDQRDLVETWIQRQRDYLTRWPQDFDTVFADAKQKLRSFAAAREQVAVTTLLNDLGRRLASVQLVTTEIEGKISAAQATYGATGAEIAAAISELEHRLAQAQTDADAFRHELLAATTRLTALAQHALDAAEYAAAAPVRGAIASLLDEARAQVAASDVPRYLAAARALTAAFETARSDLDSFVAKLPRTARDAVKAQLAALLALDNNRLAKLALDNYAGFEAELDGLIGKAGTARMAIKSAIQAIEQPLHDLSAEVAQTFGSLRSIAAAAQTEATAWIELGKELPADLRAILAHEVEARITRELAAQRAHVEHAVDRIVEAAGSATAELGDRTMRLVRAWGETPAATGLAFTRKRVAYCFHEVQAGALALSPRVTFTPVTALVNRLEQDIPGLDLHTVGLRLPTSGLDQRLIPDIKNLDLGKLFPDIAGLKLDNLFSGLKFPDLGAEGIHVKHGIDRVRRSAWVSCEVDVRIPPADVFALGPFAMRLFDARLYAHTQLEADASGVRRTIEASISGDWQFNFAGQMVAALVQTKLELDDAGKLRFQVSPASIRVAEALRFLTQLLQNVSSGDGSGLSIAPVLQGGLPSGIRAALHVALPALSSGAFSISNLSLDTHFQIAMEGSPPSFMLSAGLGFATPERPFNLSVLFLGGGGWFTTTVRYGLLGGQRSAELDIGLAAGASLPFDIGVAKGGVWLLLSLGVRWTLGGGGSLTIALAISMRGEVVILGIVSVSLYLRLEAHYISGGDGLECSGYLQLEIKLGWFFSISIEQRVTFTLAGGGRGSGEHQIAAVDSVEHYAATYEADHV